MFDFAFSNICSCGGRKKTTHNSLDPISFPLIDCMLFAYFFGF